MSGRAHRWETMPHGKRSTSTIPWPVCRRCGLVALRNDATGHAIRAGCHEPDPEEIEALEGTQAARRR